MQIEKVQLIVLDTCYYLSVCTEKEGIKGEAKTLFLDIYFLFTNNKPLKTYKINKKVENNKSILTRFWMCVAPRSWSKYTTHIKTVQVKTVKLYV